MTGEEALEHAKALKEYCSDRDNLDECCKGCPFHFYLGTRGICVMNYGLYPNEWFNPQAESDDKGMSDELVDHYNKLAEYYNK